MPLAREPRLRKGACFSEGASPAAYGTAASDVRRAGPP
ncbi:hypothetical protein SJ05684_c20470 [Sinorhizobium sojae CCBAU 05684]|uniref:Uncharacterized protein n=1 Tax=Sinorhizobium sojae CCBAU 05684 TaxID=716928 RepID=A0A249PDZ8_9HYPH|nr:hypothetical protein SJ05684_c20470 [Sinorhizobium sojae CCBAU 05684]